MNIETFNSGWPCLPINGQPIFPLVVGKSLNDKQFDHTWPTKRHLICNQQRIYRVISAFL